ncbi:MAG: HAD family hydrolase [Pseudomonadales bacterium]
MIRRGRLRRASDVGQADFEHYLAGVQAGGAGTIAFFDLDRTLIAGYSVTALAWERMRSGSVSVRRFLSSAGVLLGYGLGRADYHELLTTTVRDLAGLSEQAMTELGERAFRQRVQGWIYPEARRLVDSHRRAGHAVFIVTSATRYQAAPVARELGVDGLCCTEIEVENGRVTGLALPCFGVGKLKAAQHVAGEHRTDLQAATFYSDSSDDLPLLEAVGRPVVVNPKATLARLAGQRGWPTLVFDPPAIQRSAAA